jgi:hypothetical protein
MPQARAASSRRGIFHRTGISVSYAVASTLRISVILKNTTFVGITTEPSFNNSAERSLHFRYMKCFLTY